MAFGGNVPDENLVPGFTVQNAGGGVNYSASYVPVVGLVTTNSQAGSGYPFPPGAMNINAENSASYSTPILENASYSVSQAAAPAGTNPTAIGAVITVPTGGYTAKVVSAMNLVVQSLTAASTVSYSLGGVTVPAADVLVGSMIPGGAAITATAATVFVTAAA